MKILTVSFLILSFSVVLFAQPALEPGWPVQTGFSVSQSATAAELDGDPEYEVVIASQDGYLYVFNHDGTIMSGFPQYMGTALWPDPYANICSSPAVHDLNNDGVLEIIVGCFDANMYVFEPDGSLFPGWPFASGFTIFSTPAIGDIDGDGVPEIVYGDNSGGIYALNIDGTVCTGFPYPTPYVVRSSPALGDLDGDGFDEIVITADNNDYHLYAIDGDGTNLPGFPIQFASAIGSNSSPTLADVDDDGDLEIIVGDRSGYLHVMHHNGVYLPAWPIDCGYSLQSCPTVVNLDTDPEMEIIVGMNDSQVIIYNIDGSYLPGWPQQTAYTVISSPSVGDIDNDGELEVVVGCNTGDVYGWNLDGTTANGFPLTDPTYTVYSSPLLEDLDLDGHLEMVLGCNDTYVYAWDMGPDTYNPDLLPWPQFRLNERNTSAVVPPPPVYNIDITLNPVNPPIIIPGIGGSFEYEVIIANLETTPVNFDAWIDVELPDSSIHGPLIMRNLTLPPGNSLVRTLTQYVPPNAPWGDYLYRGHVGDYSASQVWDSDSFPFTKAPWESSPGQTGNEWTLKGWEAQNGAVSSPPPVEFGLLSAYPNPFNASTTITFTVTAAAHVRISVYNLMGREVALLMEGMMGAGLHQIKWDEGGIGSGVYLVALECNGVVQGMRKVILVK